MTQQYNQPERELGWDDQLVEDAKDVILLPDGLYQFTVTKVERGRYQSKEGSRLPDCNKATVSLNIVTAQGETTVNNNYYLHSSTESMLSSFFGAIGQKQKGVPFNMNWATVVGSTGVCMIGTKTYNGNKYNEVKRMIYVEDVEQGKIKNAGMTAQQTYQQPYQQQTYQAPQQAQAPVYQTQPVQQQIKQPVQQPVQGNYTTGAF